MTDNDQAKSGFSYRPGRRARMVGWTLLGILLFLWVLPEILRFALIRYLPDTGIGEVAIADVDFNLFDASAGLDGLVITRDGEQKLALDHLALDCSWLKLLLGQLYVERIAVSGVRLSVREHDDGRWEVVMPLPANETEPAPPAEPAPALPQVLIQDLELADIVVRVDSRFVSGDFAVDDLYLTNISTWQQAPANLELHSRWQRAPVDLSLQLSPWQETPTVSGTLKVTGLPLAGIKPGPADALQGQIDTDLTFQGEQRGGSISVTIDGKLGITDLKAGYRQLGLDHQHLAWDGKVNLTLGDELAYAVKGDLQSQKFSVVDRRRKQTLLSWDTLDLSAFAVDQAINVSFAGLRVTNVAALNSNDESSRLHTDSVDVKNLQLAQARRLEIESVDLEGGHYGVVITPEGNLQIQSILTELSEELAASDGTGDSTSTRAESPADAGESAGAAAAQPFQFRIDRIQIGGNTEIRFADRRFSLPVRENLYIENLTINHLNQIDREQEAELALQARIGEFSSLVVDGTVRPFLDKPTAAIKGNLQAMELPSLSPYSEAYLGYHLSRGQYDHKFDLHLDGENIKLNNTLHLRQLELKSVDPDKPQPLEKQLDVPLGLALDMLRDGNNNIELKVPIKGRLDDPNVNINSVINKALAKAVTSGATSYLKFALQPYGAVLMAADFVGDQVNAVRLEPLQFAAGSAELPEQSAYLDKILGLLRDRPALNLTLCGQANETDKAALEDAGEVQEDAMQSALVQLAEQRSKNLKRYFVEKEIKSQRLLLCQARYEEKGVSGIQLQM